MYNHVYTSYMSTTINVYSCIYSIYKKVNGKSDQLLNYAKTFILI